MIDYLNDVVANNWRNWYQSTPPVLDWLLLANGGTALHDNVVFLAAPQGQRQPLLVAKACRWPDYSTIPHEFGQLTAVWQQLGNQAQGRIPRPLHLGQNGADQVLLTDFFPGSVFTSRVQAAVRDIPALTQLLQRAAVWLRLLHEQTARPRTADLALQHEAYAARFAALFALPKPEQTVLREVETAVSSHTTAATTQIIQHGDFWPGNILLRADNDQLALIDWQFSTWTTDPNFDLYFLLLATAVALAGSGTPQQRGQRAAQRLKSWENSLIPAYLTTYGQPMLYQLLPPRTGFLWACLTAAARPVETFGIIQDDAPLWRTVFAALSATRLEIGNERL
ncbi:MAG: aminoglycoside phosphotransferase family protein [Chloroflexota bacterium]